jgi:DNA-binding NarL/FixJ family response regulator
MTARILLVDDHPLILEGLVRLINQQPDLEVCGEVGCPTDALLAARELGPDLMIIDLSLGSDSGLDLIAELNSRHPHIPMLVLSMHDETFYAERALKAGASGYIMKEQSPEKVVRAIQCVLEGEIYLSEKMAGKLLRRLAGKPALEETSPVSLLSQRELQVLEHIGSGLGTSEIARKLNLSVKTIETYRAHIKEKLHLEDATALRQFAIQWMKTN